MEESNELSIDGKKLSLFIRNEEIMSRVKNVASQLQNDFGDANPVFLCVLKGVFIFAADLLRAFGRPCEVSFVEISSYEGTESTGKIKTVLGLSNRLRGRNVVIVEDIIDSGLTMKYLVEQVKTYEPKDVRIVSLFTKPENLKHGVHVDYHALSSPVS